MTLKYVMLFLLLITTIIILNEPLQETLAASPSFVRQELSDMADNDGWDYLTGNFTTGHKYADLSSISYNSDGRFLNTPLFFYHPITVRQPLTVNHTAYGMLIDIDSNYKTGWQGYDYMMWVSWENNTRNWTYLLQEWSSASSTRVLENKTNFTSFLDNKESDYVYLTLDLKKINFPDNYLVVFFTDYDFQDGGVNYEISDFSNAARIPPPQFIVSTSPNSVSLRPGETKTVEVQVNSSTKVFQSHAIFSTNKIDGLQTDFTPNEADIPQSGTVTSHLNIKAGADSEPNPYTLLIFANISFPTQYSGSGLGLTKILTESIDEQSTLPLSLLPPFTTWEMLQGSGLSIKIPQEYLLGFYAIVLSLIIPGTARWFSKRREIKHLSQLMTDINTAYDSKYANKKEWEGSLEKIRRHVDGVFKNGRINEANYKILNEKISDYQKKINTGEDKSEPSPT